MLLLAPGAQGIPGPGEPPSVTPVIVGTLGSNGWYRSNVIVSWKIETDPGWPILETIGCDTTPLTVDTVGRTLECKARNDPFATPPYIYSSSGKTFKIDKTPPAATGSPARPAVVNGWYNEPLNVTFSGTDVTSGIASCTSAQYAGPDNPSAAVAGSCTDVAGNVTPASLAFRYDSTPPRVMGFNARHGDRSARLFWRTSSDTKLVEIVRSPGRNDRAESVVYRGTKIAFKDSRLAIGKKYRYRITAFDQAHNQAQRSLVMIGTGALFGPLPGARVKGLPNLAWTPVKRASYYNIQLVRGHKVLSAWPVRPGFRLRRTWLYEGHRYRLKPGVYRWYVWPGLGRISDARYGPLLGSSTFVVTG